MRIVDMKSSDFGIVPRIPAVFTFAYSVDDLPFICKQDVLEYLEYLMLSNGSSRQSASIIAELIDSWCCSTRLKKNIYQ